MVSVRCVVIDLPAHGIEAGRSTHAFETADAIEVAGNALGKVDIVVAHSLGAMATAVAMQRSLRADRLVLVAPGLRPHQTLESFAATLRLRPVVAKAVEHSMERRFGEDLWDRIPKPQTVLATDDTTSAANRELFVFARQDGEWKVARYMFNKTSA